jgi:hypothetical protein
MSDRDGKIKVIQSKKIIAEIIMELCKRKRLFKRKTGGTEII